MSSTVKIKRPEPRWDKGATDTFAAFKELLTNYLGATIESTFKLAWVLPTLNEFKLPEPSGAGSVSTKASHIATVTILLRESVPRSILKQIISKLSPRNLGIYTGQGEADLVGEAPEHGDPVNQADALWTGFLTFAKGAVSEMSGELLQDAIQAWSFPTEGSYVDRTDKALDQLSALREQTDTLDNADYPFTEAQAVRLFRKNVPNAFKLDRALYEPITTMAALSARAQTDALNYDKEASSSIDPGMRVLAAVSGLSAAELTGIDLSGFDANPAKALRALIAGGPHGGQPDQSKGQRKCSYHHSDSHTDAECYVQHPELKKAADLKAADRRRKKLPRVPAGKPTRPVDSQKKLYCVGADGKFRPATADDVSGFKGDTTTGGTALISATDMAAALAAGSSANVDMSRCVFIDNCADKSFANSLVGLHDIHEIPEAERKPFNGLGDDLAVPTHEGKRIVELSDSISYVEEVLVIVDGKFNITCTSEMAKHGISTLTSASDNGQLYTIAANHREPATRIGNIYAVPSTCRSQPSKSWSPDHFAMLAGMQTPGTNNRRRLDRQRQRKQFGSAATKKWRSRSPSPEPEFDFEQQVTAQLTSAVSKVYDGDIDAVVQSIIDVGHGVCIDMIQPENHCAFAGLINDMVDRHRMSNPNMDVDHSPLPTQAAPMSDDETDDDMPSLDNYDTEEDIGDDMPDLERLDNDLNGDARDLVRWDHAGVDIPMPSNEFIESITAIIATIDFTQLQSRQPTSAEACAASVSVHQQFIEYTDDDIIAAVLFAMTNTERLEHVDDALDLKARANQIEMNDGDPQTVKALRLAANQIGKAMPAKARDTDAPSMAAPTNDTTPPVQRQMSYEYFRRWGGCAGHKATQSLAKKLGVKLTADPKSRAQLDKASRIANQRSRPLVQVEGSGLTPSPSTRIITDTIGSKYPTAADGSTCVQTWADPADPQMYFVTFSDSPSSRHSWDGLVQYARERGLVLHNHMINSGCIVFCDGGSEYMKDFQAACSAAGIIIKRSTPHAKDGLNQIAEGVNARAQQHARVAMLHAAQHFDDIGFRVRDYWPQAYSFSALQNRARTLASRGELTFEQYRRAIPAPFGAYGSVVLQPGDPSRKYDHKQLASRGTVGILVGMNGHRCSMLLPNGEIHDTFAVAFDEHAPWSEAPVPTGTSVPSRNRAQPRAARKVNDANNTTLSNWLDLVIPDTERAPVDGGDPVTGGAASDPTFTDSNGATVSIGDRIAVEWATQGQSYPGTVTDIVNSDGDKSYRTTYDDGDDQWHSTELSSADAPPVHVITTEMVALVGRRRERLHPHFSVARHIDQHGDIITDILVGNQPLPPLPPLPEYSQSNQPPVPATVEEAMASPDALFWLQAIVAEFTGHVNPMSRPATWKFTSQRPSKWSLKAKWVFTIKFDGDAVSKFKARLCVTGHSLTRGVDFVESYCGAAYSSDNRMLESLAVQCGWDTYEDDLSQAFVQFPMPDSPSGEPVIMAPARGSRVYAADGTPFNCELVMSLYGHPSSGYALAIGMSNRLLNRDLRDGQRRCPIEFRQCDAQPVIYRAVFPVDHRHYQERFILAISTDNLRVFSSSDEVYQQYREWLNSEFTITGSGKALRASAPTSTLGKIATYGPDYVRLDMPAFQRKIIVAAGLQDAVPAPTPIVAGFRLTKDDCPGSDAARELVRTQICKMFPHALIDWDATVSLYRSLVANLNWMAKECAPVLSATVAMLSRVMHDPPTSAFRAVHRAYRYLIGHPALGITYQSSKLYDFRNGEYPAWTISTDATLGDDLTTGKPLGGAGGGFEGMAIDFWFSHTARRVCGSTLAAESYFGSAGARQAQYMSQVLTFLDMYNGPIIIRMDNANTVLHAGAPIKRWSAKSRHFTLDQKFIAQAVQDNIAKVVHQPGSVTESNPLGFFADCFTKGLPASLLALYLSVMQGPTLTAINGGE